jgi:hypothetical protein
VIDVLHVGHLGQTLRDPIVVHDDCRIVTTNFWDGLNQTAREIEFTPILDN